MKNKRVAAIVSAIVVILIGVAIFGVVKYRQVQAQKSYDAKIERKLAKVKREYQAIDTQKDKVKRLTGLQAFEQAGADYRKGKEKNKKVIKAYQHYTNLEVDYFKQADAKILKDNTIETKALSTTKRAVIQTKVDGLNVLLKTVAAEKTIVYSAKEFPKEQLKIKALIATYNARIAELKQAEEAAAAKAKAAAEAAAKATEAATVKANSTVSSSNKSTSSSTQRSGSSTQYHRSSTGKTQSGTGQTSSGRTGSSSSSPAKSHDFYHPGRNPGVPYDPNGYNLDGSATFVW